ncbi:MAG: hypothetical protein M3R04_03010 [bacterium]|nr:hypothetical protein [bacterium]
MRIALITVALILAQASASLAESRSRQERHERSRDNNSFDFGLTLDEQLFGVELGSANDRGGFRAFIPRGQQDREYYNVGSGNAGLGYRGGRPGREYGGRSDNGYYRPRSSNDNYIRRRYHRPGAYTVLEQGLGYPYYSSPTYIYPGRSPVIIDGGGSYSVYPPSSPLPPQYRGGDGGDVYTDNRVYDNDTTNNYYGDAPQRAEPSRPQSEPVKPKAGQAQGPVPPDGSVQIPAGRSSGARFVEQVRIDTPDGLRVFKFYDGALYTIAGESKTKIADGVDADFGGYALMQPLVGTTVIFLKGGKLSAAYPTESGWWTETLTHEIDFSEAPQFKMLGGNAWVTFNGTDGMRYVVALKDHKWSEVGSGTR